MSAEDELLMASGVHLNAPTSVWGTASVDRDTLTMMIDEVIDSVFE